MKTETLENGFNIVDFLRIVLLWTNENEDTSKCCHYLPSSQ